MVLVMDEVDGMSGGDRGGVTDLIDTIKRSKVPIIAICNDKYNQKLKSLRNHCLELEYRWAANWGCRRSMMLCTCKCINLARLLSTILSHPCEPTVNPLPGGAF